MRNSEAAEDVFYSYATPVERLIHLVGGGSSSHGGVVNSSGTAGSHNQQQQPRYIVLHDQGIYLNRYWKLGITRILQDVCNAVMISFQSAIHMVPFAKVTPPFRNILSQSVVLSVYISATEAQCMVSANGHTLEYTYQSCSYDNDVLAQPENGVTSVRDLRRNQETWLSHENSSSLIRALALCLINCPMPLRQEAIHNLYFAGVILVDGFQEKVATLLYKFLTQDVKTKTLQDLMTDETSDERTNASPSSVIAEFTQIPVNRKILCPLAKHIAFIDCELSSDLIPWFGTCIWINYWRLHEQDNGIQAKQMNWIDLKEVETTVKKS
jgi:hypothetical protein